MFAICWFKAGSFTRDPLNSPERSLTNSVCAGEDSDGLGVVLELAAAFVDSLIAEICLI
jgi:hypothetical protein